MTESELREARLDGKLVSLISSAGGKGGNQLSALLSHAGRAVLLLPAFSTVSSREEMRPLAEHLAARGCSCMLGDWPGFGFRRSQPNRRAPSSKQRMR